MSEFWNSKFKVSDYLYGKNPNEFFKSKLIELEKGKILIAADGEGRNAVYAAELGWETDVFDSSEVGKQKAEQLAKEKHVDINYTICEFSDFKAEKESYDCIAATFLHLTPELREKYHKRLIELLKPGGHIIMQCFNKNQINNSTGGPKNIDMLFSKEDLKSDFAELKNLKVEEKKEFLSEGKGHYGYADVVNVFGIKQD